jgi:hypothetical protein
MKSKIALSLASLPSLAGAMLSLLVVTNSAHAVEPVAAESVEPVACDAEQFPRWGDRPSQMQSNQFVCTRVTPAQQVASLPAPVNIPVIGSAQTGDSVQAAAPTAPTFTNVSVSNDSRVYENPDSEYPMLAFSEAESDAAVALFGCDCPACMNSLRQLRNLAPVTTDGRDACWTVVQRQFRRDPADVIEALSAAENNQTDFYFELEAVN